METTEKLKQKIIIIWNRKYIKTLEPLNAELIPEKTEKVEKQNKEQMEQK